MGDWLYWSANYPQGKETRSNHVYLCVYKLMAWTIKHIYLVRESCRVFRKCNFSEKRTRLKGSSTSSQGCDTLCPFQLYFFGGSQREVSHCTSRNLVTFSALTLSPAGDVSLYKAALTCVFTRLWPECDEYIRKFEYSNILVTNIYSDIRSYQFFFYKYIRTFVRVKFVCTNIFGHSLVSVLECKI